MVIFPIADERNIDSIPAWLAVEERQRESASSYWLVTQPAHAALSGELAASLREDLFGAIDDTVARSIALHDSGWSMADAEQIQQLRANPKLKPKSFVEFSADQFLRAWTASIDTAEKFAPIGGFLVSRHFERISMRNGGEDRSKLQKFRASENQRQQRLKAKIQIENAALERLVDALQFCDLLSLYLCCGSRQSIKFDCPKLTLSRSGDEYRLDPFPFREHRQFSFSAIKHPANGKPKSGATFYINV
ncbi:MAG TPA: DUF3891 family protein [Terriglobales bacterium]|nr:DUF3891 family protein [Terriglobales bacterium]